MLNDGFGIYHSGIPPIREVGTSLMRAAVGSALAIEARLRSFQLGDSDFRPLSQRFGDSLKRTQEAQGELERMLDEAKKLQAAQKKKP